MNEAVDGAMDGYGDEADVDKAYQEICEAVGMEIAGEVVAPGHGRVGTGAKVARCFHFLRHQKKVLMSGSTN